MLSNSLNDASEEIIELKALKLYSVFFISFCFLFLMQRYMTHVPNNGTINNLIKK